MATYKKKYKPEGKKAEQQAEEMDSTTAEVFNTLDETASKSEQWIEKNSKVLFGALIAVVVVFLAFLGYNKYIVEPNELEASNELAFPRKYFDEAATAGSGIDSLLNLGLEGADGNYGFLDVADAYSGTDAGNLANYYAGVSYLQMKQYDKAIEYLSKFNSDNAVLNAVSLGAIGDAFSDIDQQEDALEYYEKAANVESNEFTTPLFLYKSAQTAMLLKDFDKAENMFSIIKEKYPTSDQGKDIDKFINAAKYAKN
ncbi:tetratricopeptide repeat protein [Polaribacter dokdonensis]|uniref:TPR domain protein n=1 Tax=Polaribacter dokdonensis DSW-5 TaxID=1300348 RepID=A0A0M9CHB2_9FLAO|nr:tetratricopeptide repeat protein [Polaribacter dokdonensis]KOY52483.1 TPR domain protein [Polaribacter dokdonensis DSW-5]SEE46406.1 Tetratricopeptide repeat-containing protein [Polaribacter dokdonensis DSW-5]